MNFMSFIRFTINEIILDVERTYMLSDDDANIFYDKLHILHIENGFDVKEGYCPILIAESLERQAKDIVIQNAFYITKFTKDDLLCSKNALENYDEAINLIINLVFSLVKMKNSKLLLNKLQLS